MSPSSPDPDVRVGPYDTAADAAADGAVVYLTAERQTVDPWRVASDRVVAEADRAGVDVGDYDMEVIERVARDLDVEAAQVVLGLVARAYESGWERGSHVTRRILEGDQ